MFDTRRLTPITTTVRESEIIARAPCEGRAASLRTAYGQLDGARLLRFMIEHEFAGRIALVSSFGAESVVLLDLVARIDAATPVIFLDTGKLFAETLAYRDRIVDRLGLTDVRSIAPDAAALARNDPAGELWRYDADTCCELRKVRPLTAALADFDAWITGRKRFHGAERAGLATIEAADGRVKINPIAHWPRARVDAHIAARDLPRHPLALQGYSSIGCRPCTQPPSASETVRDGRWPGCAKTECGIHSARWMQDPAAYQG